MSSHCSIYGIGNLNYIKLYTVIFYTRYEIFVLVWMGFPTFDMTKWIEQKGRIILSISFSCFLTFFKDHHLTVVDIHTVYAYWRPYFEYISYVCTWTQSRMMLRLCSKQKVYIPKMNKNNIQLINKLIIVTFFSHHLKNEFIPRNDFVRLRKSRSYNI